MALFLQIKGGKISEGKMRQMKEGEQIDCGPELYRGGNHRKTLCGRGIHHSHVTAMGSRRWPHQQMCSLWAGLGRAGLGWAAGAGQGRVGLLKLRYIVFIQVLILVNLQTLHWCHSMLEEVQLCRTQDQNTEYIKNKQIDNSNTGFDLFQGDQMPR